jgi:hypothetical protein
LIGFGDCFVLARVSLFSLEIKVEGFCSRDSSGRKAYTKGRVIKWNVEVASFSFDLLLTSLSNEFQWSSSQSPRLWFFDKRMCEDVRLENDFQMHDLFEMYKDEMHCEVIVGVFDNCLREADEFAALEPLCVIPAELFADDNHDKEPNSKDNHSALPTNSPPGDAEYPLEPELEPDREPDMFDNDEEYVGVDDEGLYMSVTSAQAANNHSTSANVDDSVDDADDFDRVADAEGGVSLDAEVNDADPHEVHVIHDPENPKIEKGERFPNIVAFRKAVRHHAVVTGFEFDKVITDKTRFIAKCKAQGCPWCIHASRIFDGKTIEVKLQLLSF